MAAARGFVLTGPGRELWARRCALRPTKWERRGAAKPTCLETYAPSQRQGRSAEEQNEGRRGAESLEGFPGEVLRTSGTEGTMGRGKSQQRTPVQGLRMGTPGPGGALRADTAGARKQFLTGRATPGQPSCVRAAGRLVV